MAIRIGINGIGRIGRNLWRIIHSDVPDLEIVAVNDTADPALLAQLLRYDSVRGRLPARVEVGDQALLVDGAAVPLTREPTPDQIDWTAHDVELVVESTGQFTRAAAARGHLRGSVRTVIISTAAPDPDLSLMMGINQASYDPRQHRVVSNSCCTTYCIAPMLAALHRGYGVRSGMVTAAYSSGSRPGPLLDEVFPNLRMARANAVSIVPANVPGVRHALDKVLPELAGRVEATLLRVPVRAVSAAVLTLHLTRPASVDGIHHALADFAATAPTGLLELSADPLVSSDLIGSPVSCMVDTGLTAARADLVRLVGWYDNEWGYSHRLVDLIKFLGEHW